MKKCTWRACLPPTADEQKELIQVYEFIRIPQDSSNLTELRVFFDTAGKELLRSRKYANGNVEWYKTNPFTDVVEVN